MTDAHGTILDRRLGPIDAAAIVVSNVIGGGILFTPPLVAATVPRPWLFLSVERQSELHVYRLNEDGTLPGKAMFIKSSLIDRASSVHTQMAGAIHVHPNGRFVYASNRARETESAADGFAGGANDIAVFAIDPETGVPRFIQRVELLRRRRVGRRAPGPVR